MTSSAGAVTNSSPLAPSLRRLHAAWTCYLYLSPSPVLTPFIPPVIPPLPRVLHPRCPSPPPSYRRVCYRQEVTELLSEDKGGAAPSELLLEMYKCASDGGDGGGGGTRSGMTKAEGELLNLTEWKVRAESAQGGGGHPAGCAQRSAASGVRPAAAVLRSAPQPHARVSFVRDCLLRASLPASRRRCSELWI